MPNPWQGRAGAAFSLVPAALRPSQVHPSLAAPRERNPSVPPRRKLCPEHPMLLGASVAVPALGPGAKQSWKHRSPTAPHPGTTFPQRLSFEVTLQSRPLLWGNGDQQSRQSPWDAREEDLCLVAPCQAQSSITAAPGLGCCLLTSAPCCNLRQGTRLPRVTQHQGLAWEKTSGLRGEGLRPAGQSLGAHRGQLSPGSKHCSQNPPGKEAFKPWFWRGVLCSLWGVLLTPPPCTDVPWARVPAVP